MSRYLSAPVRLLRTLHAHRFLLAQLASRAFASRHAGSLLGWLWTPLGTAVQFVLYTVVFSMILGLKIEMLGIDLAKRVPVGFGVFLITGLVPYLALNDVIMKSSRVIRANATLVQRVRLPLEVMVVGDILGTLMHHATAVVLMILYCGWAGHLALAGAGWLAAGIVLLLLLAIGFGLLVSVLGVALPDIPEVLGLVLQFALYGAPIIYSLTFVKQDWRIRSRHLSESFGPGCSVWPRPPSPESSISSCSLLRFSSSAQRPWIATVLRFPTCCDRRESLGG